MRKIIASGLLSGIIMLAAGMLVGKIFQFAIPSISIEYQNTNLFRPWSDPVMLLMLIHPFLVGIIMAMIWNHTKNIIKGTTLFSKGIRFGLVYWTISIPGMLISYSTFPISLALTVSWSAAIMAQSLLSGILFSAMLKQ
ncbi:MAG TPA: hypothetical protein VII99_06970 [Bacteroidia bacterium]